MQITDFLKKYSIIDSKFIDDFYSFYNEGQNEYDFAIDLENIAFWLEVQKGHLKTLLEANFIKNQDYIETKPQEKLHGIGKNNIKIVLLNYNCAKMLCMISRSEKSHLIRKYYIELEKLLIRHKDDIDENIHRQIGIEIKNKTTIERNKNSSLIYVLKVDDETHKIGKTIDLKNRMKQYKVGRISELPIVFVYKTDKTYEIEKCIKNNLAQYQAKSGTELYKIDINFIKDTIEYCAKRNAMLIKSNKKLYEANDNKNWLIIIDKQNIDNINELFNKPKKNKVKTPNNKSKLVITLSKSRKLSSKTN